MMSSGASMVSKLQPKFKGPPNYCVTPKVTSNGFSISIKKKKNFPAFT